MTTVNVGQLDAIILAIIIGTLAAIVWSLRVLFMVERRIARMDENILKITKKVLAEEIKIENVEKNIQVKVKKK